VLRDVEAAAAAAAVAVCAVQVNAIDACLREPSGRAKCANVQGIDE
jgi:hypothetical protein